MPSLPSRLMLELPMRPSRSLGYRRLRRPTPLPSLRSPLAEPTLGERLLALFHLPRS
jgi:hypothetical protein